MWGSRVDDSREASRLNAGLAIGIITGTATTIAAATALLAFAVGNFQITAPGILLWIVSFGALVVSAVSGGLGLRDVLRQGWAGNWDRGIGRRSFSRQTVLYLTGVSMLATATLVSFSGVRLETSETAVSAAVAARTDERIANLRDDLDRMRVRLETFETMVSTSRTPR